MRPDGITYSRVVANGRLEALTVPRRAPEPKSGGGQRAALGWAQRGTRWVWGDNSRHSPVVTRRFADITTIGQKFPAMPWFVSRNRCSKNDMYKKARHAF